MEIQVYYGEHPRYRHENEQLNEMFDLVQGSDREGPVTTAARQFICTEYVAPARAAGYITFAVSSGRCI